MRLAGPPRDRFRATPASRPGTTFPADRLATRLRARAAACASRPSIRTTPNRITISRIMFPEDRPAVLPRVRVAASASRAPIRTTLREATTLRGRDLRTRALRRAARPFSRARRVVAALPRDGLRVADSRRAPREDSLRAGSRVRPAAAAGSALHRVVAAELRAAVAAEGVREQGKNSLL